jgi:predicted nucleic-acid-binding protein
MIAVDTNVLVRYVTHDDPVQGPQAMQALDDPQGVFVGKTVILELEWVLRAAYRLSRQAVETALLMVAGLPRVVLENPDQVALALDYYRQGLDFADALHYAASLAATSFHTFDARFANRGQGLGLNVHAIADILS